MKYGIFGGTFDPFTIAHFEIVGKILADNLVDKVIVIPTIVDYYRKDKERLFTNEQRLEIISKWFSGRNDVVVDDYEYRFVLSTTKDGNVVNRRYLHMLLDVIDRYGKDNEYYTIIGGDSWNKLDTWYEWEQLFDYSQFIVVKRDEDNLKEHWIEYVDQIWTCRKMLVTIDKRFTDMSATKVRDRILTVSRHRQMTPLAVYVDYIAITKGNLDCTI